MGKSYFGSWTRWDFIIAFDIFLKCLRIGFDGELGEFGAMGSRP